jgi:MFS transporter, FSR family, fosmidomycin resistance protein
VIVGGGAAFAAGLVALALAGTSAVFLAATCVLYPASGAFVSLSQATLMDLAGGRRDLAMNRWVLAGGVGVLAGPALVAAAIGAGLGWRAPFLAMAAAAACLAAAVRRLPVRRAAAHGVRAGALEALRLLARRPILRGLALLELANLQLDLMHALLGVYLVDTAGAGAAAAAVALGIVAAVSLAGNVALPVLLRRWSSEAYLTGSAAATLIIYPAVLLAPSAPVKVGAAACVGLLTCGWYPLLMASLYDALPGRSGAATALTSVSGTLAGLLPLGLGALAARYGLSAAMWALLAGPVGLVVLLPRRGSQGARG